MGKRKVEEEEVDSDIDVSSTDSEDEQVEEQSKGEEREEGEDEEMINVDFDFFDLNPEVDFHATKNFLRQLFGDDASEFDLSGLADLILTKNSVGTSIKTDGVESDPFALLSVVNMTENLTKPSIKKLVDYILNKTKGKTEFNIMLKKLLTNVKTTNGNSKQLKVGLIVSERMINMPIEVIPPMYRMLLEEMEKAEDAHEKYEFDYFLIVSKVYQLVNPEIEQDDDDDKRSKKKKIASNEPKQIEMDYFHYEDMILEQNASYRGVFPYTQKKQETDSRRVFTEYGIDPKLSLILIDKDNLAKSVIEMQESFPAPQ
ncbi:BCP1 [[Candida] subhashii]|uniref:Protein BCP1 n=1 Tax=[Candida] subhashii TaxID=561895 RepID=A0A8J5QIW1_9ASCO|nr:BCP1 [[Candida] subhashii]KAG7662784.1 BCP1 [[Candida] subhashii]